VSVYTCDMFKSQQNESVVDLLHECFVLPSSGSTVNVSVQLEREDEVAGPVIAPLFPQVTHTFLSSRFSNTSTTNTPLR